MSSNSPPLLPQTGEARLREHELKTWPEFYRELESGAKTFEIRRDDRGFNVGDVLWLREWRRLRIVGGVAVGEYTGREMRRVVSYVLSGQELSPGFVCMGLSAGSAQAPETPPVPDWLLQKLRTALDAARRTISVGHPVREQVEAAMCDIDFYQTATASSSDEQAETRT